MDNEKDPFGIYHLFDYAGWVGSRSVAQSEAFTDAVCALFTEDKAHTAHIIREKCFHTLSWPNHCSTAAIEARAHGIPDDTIRFLVAIHLGDKSNG